MRIHLTLTIDLDDTKVDGDPAAAATELADQASDAIRWHDAVLQPVSVDVALDHGGRRVSAPNEDTSGDLGAARQGADRVS
jgi:hypothetical protein